MINKIRWTPVDAGPVPTDSRILIRLRTDYAHYDNYHIEFAHWNRLTKFGRAKATHWAAISSSDAEPDAQ